MGNIDNEAVAVTPQEIYDAIMKVGDNKAYGTDNTTSEHLKLVSKKLYPSLTIGFTGPLVHDILPDSILSVLLANN